MRLGLVSGAFLNMLIAATAYAGHVQDYVDAHGGCSNPSSLYVFSQLRGHHSSNVWGKPAVDWTDADIDELKKVYTLCLRRWPATEVAGSFSPDQEFIPNAGAIEGKVNQVVADLMNFDIEPARVRNRSSQAALAAKQRLEKANTEAIARSREEQAKSQQESLLAATTAAQNEAVRRREAMRKQAKADRVAAEQAQKSALEEQADAKSVQKEADAAHEARLQAEERLAKIRASNSNYQKSRAEEDHKAALLDEEHRVAEHKEQERRADESLTKNCVVTADQFKRAALGMTLHQIRQNFGCLGTLSNSTQLEGVGTLSTYAWQGAGAGFSSTVFTNGRLVSKSQTGLE